MHEEDDDTLDTIADEDDERRSPERVAKSERILNLIAVLLRAEEPVPISSILGKVTGYDDKATRESLMRRFERDKKVLRDMGIPVEHAVGGAFGVDGYIIPRQAYFLDELQLPADSGQLLRALFAWAHAGGGELSEDLRSALVKLGYFVEEGEEQPPARATEALEPGATPKAGQAGAAAAQDVGANLELLSEAVLHRRRVRLRYHSLGRDEVAERHVQPYGLGFAGQAWNRGAWYLVGHCELRKDLRVFKVKRILGRAAFARPQGDGDEYEIPAGFRVREHLGRTRWEYQDLVSALSGPDANPRFTARVRFEAAIAPEVRSHVPSARLVARDEAWETLEFDVHRRRPFVRFLLRYVPRFQVVDPPDLEEAVRELAREVLALYREEGAPAPTAAPAGGAA